MNENQEEKNLDRNSKITTILKILGGIALLIGGRFFFGRTPNHRMPPPRQEITQQGDEKNQVSNRKGSARGFIKGFLDGLHGGK
ncbi:hypothetical protein FACS1894126_3780 [Alphaproteobacteria bacterium]|nr:hypothetical protein FACS1894126_3780 [Alphaproteobacteria bacterium]